VYEPFSRFKIVLIKVIARFHDNVEEDSGVTGRTNSPPHTAVLPLRSSSRVANHRHVTAARREQVRRTKDLYYDKQRTQSTIKSHKTTTKGRVLQSLNKRRDSVSP
jgi:hypothetical protein